VKREYVSQRRHSKALEFDFANKGADGLANMEEVDMKELLISMIKAAELGGRQVVSVRKKPVQVQSKGKTKEGINDPLTEGDLRSHHIMVHGLSATFPGLRIISEENHSEAEDGRINSIHPLQINPHQIHFNTKIRALPDVRVSFGDVVVWIDPLDATKEYSENLTQYVTTMVCLAVNGVPKIGVVHKPFTRETYWAWAGYGMSDNLATLIHNRAQHQKGQNDSMRFIVSRSHAGNVKDIASRAFTKSKIRPAGGSGFKSIELVKGKVDAYVHVTHIKKWDICAPNAILGAIEGGKMTTLRGETISYNYDDGVLVKDGLLATIDKDHEEMVKILGEALVNKN